MFESAERLADGGAADTAVACAAALADSVVAQRRVAAERLALVARWADLHHPDAVVPADATPHRARTQRVRFRIGAEGTPEVSEYAATELGMLLQTTTGSAERLLRDVLELRHRMPLLWQAVMTGQVEDWKARKIIATTRVLSLEKCLQVDEQVLEAAIGLPFSRTMSVVEGKVIAADPAGHETRRDEEAQRQHVTMGRRDNPYGLRNLIARGQAADMIALLAMVDHLATLLGAAGNTDPAGVRRATALAMLADPARVCLFLADTDATTIGTTTDDDDDDQRLSLPTPEPIDTAARLGELLAGLGPTALDRLRPVSVLHLYLAAVTGHLTDTSGNHFTGARGDSGASGRGGWHGAGRRVKEAWRLVA